MIDIERREVAPESLAANERNDGDDVVTALYADFLGKCYLCETKVEMGTFTVDHRKPKGREQFPELRCAWTNLFPTCNTHNCNGRRAKTYPEGGLLDPGAGHRLEQRLVQRLERPSTVLSSAQVAFRFQAVDPRDAAAVNTATELDRIHSGTGSYPPAQRTAGALRAAILRQVSLINAKLRELQGAEGVRHAELSDDLRVLFGRGAPYTKLMRSFFARFPGAAALFDDAVRP